jgi:hypothetical protein
MDRNQVGFIAHGVQGFWFAGPLPSPDCARLLVQFHEGIDIDEIPEDVRRRLNEKWQLQQDFAAVAKRYPDHAKRVKWAINLESLAAEGPDVREALDFINRLNIPVFIDTGPYFPDTIADAWSGEAC